MSDVFCPRCGEPWDIYEFHDVPGKTFDQAREAFARTGCAVFEASCNAEPDRLRAEASALVLDLLGDDIDGAASLLEDYFA